MPISQSIVIRISLLGLAFSWNNPNDEQINIELYSESGCDSGTCIKVSNLQLAKEIIANFHFANRMYLEKLDEFQGITEVTK